MATIVNNPGDGNGNGGGWVIAVVVIVILLILAFFVFGMNDADDAQNVPQQVEDNTPPTVNNTFNSTTTINPTTTPQ